MKNWKCDKCGHQWGFNPFAKYVSCRAKSCKWPWHTIVEVEEQ